jgi:hypothetical protein
MGSTVVSKVLRVGPDPHRRALLAVVGPGLAHLERLDDVAAGERDRRHLAIAVDRGFQPLGQGVGHRDTDAVQPAGEAVGATLALVELAAGMQAREHQFDHGRLLFRMQAERDAAAVVLHAHGAVAVQGHLHAFAVPGQGLVGGVVQHLLQRVQGVVGARVHAGPLLDGLQAFQHADRTFGVLGGFGGHRGANCSRRALSQLDGRTGKRTLMREAHQSPPNISTGLSGAQQAKAGSSR